MAQGIVNNGYHIHDERYYTESEIDTKVSELNSSISSEVSARQGADTELQNKINLLTNYVTPQMFGAVGDGVIDDTQALQLAINSGLPVLLPIGTYLTETLTINGKLSLFGCGGAKIKNLNGKILSANNCNEILISGVKFENNGFYGVYCNKCNNITIERCCFINFDYGIFISNSNNIVIDKNTLSDGKYYGICVNLSQDSEAICDNVVISNNNVTNIKNSDTASDSVDGQGIIVYGKTGKAPYNLVKNAKIYGNTTNENGRSGICVIGGEYITIENNECNGNVLNTQFASGISISEACSHIKIMGNTCNKNQDGINLDVATYTPGESILFGNFIVADNIANENVQSGIRNNNAPKLTISGNSIVGSDYGIFSNQNAQGSIISNNRVKNSVINGIRLIGNDSVTEEQQKNVIVSCNVLDNCGNANNNINSSLFIGNYKNVVVENNIITNSKYCIFIDNTSTGIKMLNNTLKGVVVILKAKSMKQWNDELSDVTGFSSLDFGGNGIEGILLENNFVLQHFGRNVVIVKSNNEIESSSIQAGSYNGQSLTIVNNGGANIVMKNANNVHNTGGTDFTLESVKSITYHWLSNGWRMTN